MVKNRRTTGFCKNNIAFSIWLSLQSQKFVLQHKASFSHFQKPQSAEKPQKPQEIHMPTRYSKHISESNPLKLQIKTPPLLAAYSLKLPRKFRPPPNTLPIPPHKSHPPNQPHRPNSTHRSPKYQQANNPFTDFKRVLDFCSHHLALFGVPMPWLFLFLVHFPIPIPIFTLWRFDIRIWRLILDGCEDN
jgi:hypothetical protein